MNLELYQFNRVACRVRRGKLNEWDKIIVREVQEHYAFSGLNYAQQHTVIDVGANIGAFSLWVLAQNPDAQVIAVEVDSDNAAVLKLNLAELATVYHNRLGYEQGDFVIEELDYCAGSNRVVRRGDSKIVAPKGQSTHFKEITVKPITLETILKKHKLERIHILKLDCEGA
ncbi:MAG: FkbM family methyltransferase, partial [Anaerolineae bacterium]|nr:FkbM family methyltransferase [Anaerolineae bacterium]